MSAAASSSVSPVSTSARWSVIMAFAAIYVLWGSTFFAIRVAVATVPPFFAAGVRFVFAGLVLLAYVALRGAAMPKAFEWKNLVISAALLFVPSYGGLFWAEKTVPSGIAAAMVSTIPVWIALMEVFVLRQISLRWQLVASTLFGMGGVSILTLRGAATGSHSIWPYAAMALSQISWAAGTILTKNMQLPASKPLVSGAQMALGGAMLLLLSAGAGELSPFPHVNLQAGVAIFYLASAGSIVAFTAYLWLLGRFPASTVGSYAYVNPLVALALGVWLGHEVLDLRVFAGTFLILIAVILILNTRRASKQ